MNDNFKAWLTALRSGDYAQGEGFLRTNEGFCCLGVACDLAAKAGVITTDPPLGGSSGSIWSYGNGFTIQLPPSVERWLGVAHQAITVRHDGKLVVVTYLNDRLRLSFNEIADLLEETYS